MSARDPDSRPKPTKRVWLLPAIIIGGGIIVIALIGVSVVLWNYNGPTPAPDPPAAAFPK